MCRFIGSDVFCFISGRKLTEPFSPYALQFLPSSRNREGNEIHSILSSPLFSASTCPFASTAFKLNCAISSPPERHLQPDQAVPLYAIPSANRGISPVRRRYLSVNIFISVHVRKRFHLPRKQPHPWIPCCSRPRWSASDRKLQLRTRWLPENRSR